MFQGGMEASTEGSRQAALHRCRLVAAHAWRAGGPPCSPGHSRSFSKRSQSLLGSKSCYCRPAAHLRAPESLGGRTRLAGLPRCPGEPAHACLLNQPRCAALATAAGRCRWRRRRSPDAYPSPSAARRLSHHAAAQEAAAGCSTCCTRSLPRRPATRCAAGGHGCAGGACRPGMPAAPRSPGQLSPARAYQIAPCNALQIIGSQLVAQDKLGSPETAARDVASLAMTCR